MLRRALAGIPKLSLAAPRIALGSIALGSIALGLILLAGCSPPTPPPHRPATPNRPTTPHRPGPPTPGPVAIPDPPPQRQASPNPAPAPQVVPELVTAIDIGAPLRSEALPSGLFNPMPGGIVGGYPADTGLDIAGFHLPVYAIAAGTLVYSEAGHTAWATDDRAVLLKLDEPLDSLEPNRRVTHIWYAHLSRLRFEQGVGHPAPRHVEAGELLGISGIANRSPHLHLGLLLDGVTSQRWDSYLLDDACRLVLGGWRRGQRLGIAKRTNPR
jgi:murein DD-endopeptidase MepM/ murein hydrolase activator NlpD